MQRRSLLAVALLLVLALVLAACQQVDDDLGQPEPQDPEPTDTDDTEDPGDEEPEPEPEPEPTTSDAHVRVGLTLEPPTLDFTQNAAAAIPEVLLYNVMETLVELRPGGEIAPLLAESWERSDDGLVYTFNLREAQFHDGTPLSADDVVFSFTRAMDPDVGHPFAGNFGPVESVEATDDRTVVVTLLSFSNNWLFNMTRSPGIIYSELHVEQLAEAPLGTGPFMVGDWLRGDRIELERYPDYWGETPDASRVTYRYIEDPNALTSALQTQDLDIIARMTAPELLQVFEQDPDFEVLEGLSDGQVQLTMNNGQSPLDDVLVRQAVSYAVDAEAVRDTTYGGYGELIGTHAAPGDPWYVDLSGRYAHDPDRARELLEEAGYGDGLSLTMKLPPPPYARRGGEVIAGQLEEVGIDVTIENVEWAQWLDEVFGQSDFDLTIVAHVEPRDIAQYGNTDYYWQYDNPEVAEWLGQADASPDESERDALYQQVQEQITEDAVNVWMYILPELAVVRDGIEEYNPDRLAGSINIRHLKVAF